MWNNCINIVFLKEIETMIVIADSGSSKTSWVIVHQNKVLREWTTIGLNPNFVPKTSIRETIFDSFKNDRKIKIDEISVYCSGCLSKVNQNILRSEFETILPQAKVNIESDILGACRATNGNLSGYVGIMGTGSLIAKYDGDKVVSIYDGLGYVLGDSAGGSNLGKELLKAWLFKEMPEDLRNLFQKEYKLKEKEVISTVYDKNTSHASYFGQFCPFLKQHENKRIIKEILEKQFHLFFSRFSNQRNSDEQITLNLVGSIAYYFHKIITEIALIYNIKIGIILKEPINKLVNNLMREELNRSKQD